MKPPSKLILSVAAACGLFTASPARAFDFDSRYHSGYSSHHHHHSSGYCYDRTVAWAQSILKDLGYYYGCVDGVFGSQTRRALIRYQCDHDLPHTGWLDSRTVRMLREE
jgi:Putative peptidoglycan binding domain